MPPSRGKGKTRARRAPAAEAHEPSDLDNPEAIQTPSRSGKKRGRVSDAATSSAQRNTRRKIKDARTLEREDTDGTEAQDLSDAETESAVPTEQEIISHLKVADRHVNATEDFANDLLEGQENVPGYGKIAGRDWAFIMRKVEVNIGRPEAQEKMTVNESGQPTGPSAKTIVDIDLGPDRQVSRSHAIISYDPDNVAWFIVVNGRNGLRVDNNLLKRGQKTYLRNGSVIEIANTQMAFITTASEDNDGPVWDASIIKQAQKSSDDDEGDNEKSNPYHRAYVQHPASRNPMSGGAALPSADYGTQQQRSHPHSQRSAQAGPPGTPMRSQPGTMKSSPAANYARGVMMESTESIDYSADGAKDLKPPHSYAQLIGMAILSTQEQQMTLNNIYKWIMAHYAFYRFNTGGWQNSIRHNLSLNKAFTKIARRTDEPGKGMKWMIEPTEFDTFVQQGMKGCRRPNAIPGTQSMAGSPTSPRHAQRSGANGIKRDGEVTPPFNAYRPMYPTATEAYTPERGSKRQIDEQKDSNVGLVANGEVPDYDFLSRSTPRNGMNAIANASGSPPALYVNEEGRVGPLDTPFPLRPSQRLAPPSTLKRPSDFIQFSSPAPFWKMEGLVGSTPFKPYDLSPLKTPFSGFKKEGLETKKESDSGSVTEEKPKLEEDAESKGKGSPIIQSSSPPRPIGSGHALDASPTASRPNTAVTKSLSQLAAVSSQEHAALQAKLEQSQTSDERPRTAELAPPAPVIPSAATHTIQAPAVAQNAGSQHQMNNYRAPPPASQHASYPVGPGPMNGFAAEDGEEDGIDLAKGFQPIGTFHQHQRGHLAMGMAGAPAAYGR
ncbi:fork head domain-containing protein [Acrodontium crateriforme]|uniref:Fork head domain-containing protein n=1 Tax=Acrodontium crateriforme TaxID=150365 RepID=A0AAQ3LYP4_9PEZI|nr:fork head domain-containing protein [Acrodontium crateriforme]